MYDFFIFLFLNTFTRQKSSILFLLFSYNINSSWIRAVNRKVSTANMNSVGDGVCSGCQNGWINYPKSLYNGQCISPETLSVNPEADKLYKEFFRLCNDLNKGACTCDVSAPAGVVKLQFGLFKTYDFTNDNGRGFLAVNLPTPPTDIITTNNNNANIVGKEIPVVPTPPPVTAAPVIVVPTGGPAAAPVPQATTAPAAPPQVAAGGIFNNAVVNKPIALQPLGIQAAPGAIDANAVIVNPNANQAFGK